MDDMGNISKWLQTAEQELGEAIEAIVVGQHTDRPDKYLGTSKPLPDEHVVLSREEGLAKLNQEHEDGFGFAACFPMYAWSKSFVFLIHEYDGATRLAYVPRHPMPCGPNLNGADDYPFHP